MAIAKPGTAVDRQQAISIVEGILELFENSVNNHSKPSSSEVGQYIASNIQFQSNGMTVARNINDYIARIEKASNLFSNISASDLLGDPLIGGNQIAVRYDVTATKNTGGKIEFHVIAMIAIENNKVTQWSQVVHEKGTGAWDA